MQRPDLTTTPSQVIRYIEYLENRLGIKPGEYSTQVSTPVSELNYFEPETTQCLVTLSASNVIKRSYRHLYSRQHRGGMGIFDLETSGSDFPNSLAVADETQVLLLFTTRARVFRLALKSLDPQVIRSKGTTPLERLGLDVDERIVAALPEQARGYVALVSRTGKVKSLRHHVFGEHMRQGNPIYNLSDFGPLASAAWTPGDSDLLVVTRSGIGIRFPEKSIPPQGGNGIKVTNDDVVVGITAVDDSSLVFLAGADGKGTMRSMRGFAPNKTPGGSGKIVFKNEMVLGAYSVQPEDDIFMISRQSKIIRFRANEIPDTEGVVQGVHCMALRADEVTAIATCPTESVM